MIPNRKEIHSEIWVVLKTILLYRRWYYSHYIGEFSFRNREL